MNAMRYSWGGAVLKGDDGRFHMWAAEMTEHCGIGAWSQVPYVHCIRIWSNAHMHARAASWFPPHK